MDRLEHDARTKQQIKDLLYSFIYEPVQRQFKTRLETLIVRNAVMGGYGHKHFSYKGQVYNADTTIPPLRKNRLMAALRPEMDSYLADLDKLNTEELPYVLGFLNQVLNSSCDIEDYLRVMPEALHEPLRKLQATCPCRTSRLTPERIEQLRLSSVTPVTLIKERLVRNLLI